MSDRTFPFEKESKCEQCGAIGAFDIYGDLLCGPCLSSITPTTQSREAVLAQALQWALDRLPACVAMPTSHDFNQYEKYRVLASTTPAPVGDELPGLANARREGAEAALRVAADRLKYYGHSANLVDEIRAIDPVTILAQHRDVPPTP